MLPSNFSTLLWPGLRQVYGDSYSQYPEQYSKIFNLDTSDKYKEEDQQLTTLGLVPEKGIGDPIAYDAAYQGYTKTYTHKLYGLGFIIARETFEDAQYRNIRALPQSLARSVRHTIEIIGANVLNRAFTAAYAGADALELCSLLHPLLLGGTWQNEPTTAADLDITSLEQAFLDIADWTDDRGLKIALRPKMLIVPPALEWDAIRLLKSEKLPDTANNDINPARGILPFTVLNWLTSAKAWFILTDLPPAQGLNFFWRRRPEFKNESDFDTDIAKYKTTFRCIEGWTDPRCIYGSPGV